MKRARLALLLLGSILLVTSNAEAAGFEVFPAGTRAAGRGGADFVGTDSPIALLYNPSQLAGLRRHRAAASIQIHFADLCFDRVIVDPLERGPTLGSTVPVGTEQPRVCNTGSPGPIPQLGFSFQLADWFVLGLGLFAPPAIRGAQYGSGDLRLDDEQNTRNPARYGLLKQDLLQVFPTVGFGIEVTDWLRIGAAMGFGITQIDTTTAAYGGSLIGDTKAHVTGSDSFVPRPSFGVHVRPGFGLELGAMFTWTQDVHATNGQLEISPEILGGLPIGTIEDVQITSPQTWTAAFGLRYAHKLDSPADEIGDRLSTERFDIEADVMFVRSSRMDNIVVDPPDDAQILGLIDAPDLILQPHNWKDQLVVRVGGDVAVVPGLFAIRAGFSHETNGVTRGFETLDFWNLSRTGLHMGVTFRLLKWVDFSVSFVHLFQETVTNTAATSQLRRSVSEEFEDDGVTPNPDQPRTRWNAGTFRSNYDAIMVELGINLWKRIRKPSRSDDDEDDDEDDDFDDADDFRRSRGQTRPPVEEEPEEVEEPPPPPPPAPAPEETPQVEENPYSRPQQRTPTPAPAPRRRDDDPNSIDWRRNY